MKKLMSFSILICVLFINNSLYSMGPVVEKEEVTESASVTQITRATFTPVDHASFVIQTGNVSIYVDPIGDASLYAGFSSPDIILITDIHRDHLSVETINAIKQDNTIIVAPQAVVDKLQVGTVLSNGESMAVKKVHIEAIPMYNTTPQRLMYHPKGRGNGYVLTINRKRIYISGDTEDIPEMRELRRIDYAFVCMNLPYTMPVEKAASAILEFRPKVVYPYHYRGKDGYSDMTQLKELLKEQKDITVKLLGWYE